MIPDSLATPDPKAKTALLITAIVTLFLMGCGVSMLGPTLPVFAAEFHQTTASAAWLVSLHWIGSLTGVAAVYVWSERLSLGPSLIAIGLGCALLAFSPVWPVALIGALVFGLGFGSVAGLVNPRVVMVFGARGPSVMSLINAVFSLGTIMAPYGFVWLKENPRPVFGAVVVMAILAWVLARPVGTTGVVHREPGKGVRLHLPILGLAMLAIGIEVSLPGLGPSALIRTGMTDSAAARLLGVFFLVMLLSRIGLIAIADRIPAFALFTFAAIWAWLCALGAIWFGPLLFFPALGVAAGLFFQGEYVTALRKMGDDPRIPAIIMGNGLIGAVLSPLIYSRLMEVTGPNGFFWIVAVVAGAVSVASILSYRRMIQ